MPASTLTIDPTAADPFRMALSGLDPGPGYELDPAVLFSSLFSGGFVEEFSLFMLADSQQTVNFGESYPAVPQVFVAGVFGGGIIYPYKRQVGVRGNTSGNWTVTNYGLWVTARPASATVQISNIGQGTVMIWVVGG